MDINDINYQMRNPQYLSRFNWEIACKGLSVDFRYKLSRDGLEALQRRARRLKTHFALYAYEWIFRDRETPATNRQIIPTEVPVNYSLQGVDYSLNHRL